MPDGMPSGLSMSEIGQAAKQTGGQMKKLFDPFVKTAQSQITGKPAGTSQGGGAGGVKATQASHPPSETTPTSGTFDLSSLAQGFKQQITGAKPTPQPGRSMPGMQKPQQSTPIRSGPTSQPPNEFIPVQKTNDAKDADIFDMAKMPGKNPIVDAMQQPSIPQMSSEEQQKKQMEEQKQMEILRNKLHDEAVRQTMEVGQTQGKKQEEEKKKKEQEEQEEKEKKRQKEEQMLQPISATSKRKKGGFFQKAKKAMSDTLSAMIGRNKGSHEGRGGKG